MFTEKDFNFIRSNYVFCKCTKTRKQTSGNTITKTLKAKERLRKALTRDEAERALVKHYEELNKGINPINKKTNIKEAGELYLRLHTSTNCKPSTYKTYEGYLNNIIVPFFGDLNISEISPILIKEFMKQMQDNGRANATVNKYIKFISAISNFMIDSDAAVRNPLARIKSLKEVKNKKIRALCTEEVQALLSKTKQVYPDFFPLLFTALFTGMRKGEILALTWDSINWITQKITVDKNYTHGGLGTPKTGKIRVIDMSNELAKVLKEWRLACPKGENNLVFPNNEGNYQSAENMMKRRFLPALNRTGIDRIRFHDLRHTYASLLLANGAPMKYVQHQLGHSLITMTMDLYTHLLPEVNDKCVNLLNSIVNQTIESQENVKIFGT